MKMDKKILKINLLDSIPGSKDIFAISGRDLGYKQRKHHKLDTEEDKYECIEIYIDERIIFLSSSFFLGMFGDSVRKCKTRDTFKEKFKFIANDQLNSNIEDGINDALKDVNPLV